MSGWLGRWPSYNKYDICARPAVVAEKEDRGAVGRAKKKNVKKGESEKEIKRVSERERERE